MLSLRCVWPFATPWTVSRQALLSMGLPRQEYCSGLLYPPPQGLLTQGSNHISDVSCTGRILYHCTTWEGPFISTLLLKTLNNVGYENTWLLIRSINLWKNSVQFSRVRLFATPWIAAHQALSFTKRKAIQCLFLIKNNSLIFLNIFDSR